MTWEEAVLCKQLFIMAAKILGFMLIGMSMILTVILTDAIKRDLKQTFEKNSMTYLVFLGFAVLGGVLVMLTLYGR